MPNWSLVKMRRTGKVPWTVICVVLFWALVTTYISHKRQRPLSHIFSDPLSLFRQKSDVDYQGDDSEARRLAKEVRILVWVMTCPMYHHTKDIAVRDTWGRRANQLLFMSTMADQRIPTIGLNVTEGKNNTVQKCQAAWQYVYKNHFNDADWFLKADDDTYVVMENLRHFLSGQNTNEPVFFGHHFRKFTEQGYFSGGGGYVISKEALRRYGEKGDEIQTICQQEKDGEDWKWAECMENLGVRAGDSHDVLGRTRFHCFEPQRHLNGSYPPWYFHYRNSVGTTRGVNGISDYAITFHYVTPKQMFEMEYFTYHLTPYGIIRGRENLNKP